MTKCDATFDLFADTLPLNGAVMAVEVDRQVDSPWVVINPIQPAPRKRLSKTEFKRLITDLFDSFDENDAQPAPVEVKEVVQPNQEEAFNIQQSIEEMGYSFDDFCVWLHGHLLEHSMEMLSIKSIDKDYIRIQREIANWMLAASDSSPFGFGVCCRLSGVNPQRFTEQLIDDVEGVSHTLDALGLSVH